MDYSPEFRKTLDLIYSFTMNGRKNKKLQGDMEPPSLDVMWTIMDFLDHPQNAYPVIHIAGTKGKGSTANFISNSLEKAGYSVGLYTSPHLHDFSERIQCNGVLMPHDAIAGTIEKLKPFFEEKPDINTFEIITAIAFDHFRKEKIDIAVVEVGLGGRFDATNVVNPLLSVITSISFDHVDLLGDTLAKIAFEKAGIIKPGVPVVFGKQNEEVSEVLTAIANERKSPIVNALDYSTEILDFSLKGQTFTIGEHDRTPLKVSIPLIGQHQVENAVLAFAGLQKMNELGFSISDAAIKSGFRTVSWPARLEVISMKPLIIADGAHNVDSVRRILDSLNTAVPSKKVHLLFGVSHGKDVQGMLEELLPSIDNCIFTRSVHPKSMDPNALVQLAERLGYSVSSENKIETALEQAVSQVDDDTVLLCTGSLFIAAAVCDIWKTMKPKMKE